MEGEKQRDRLIRLQSVNRDSISLINDTTFRRGLYVTTASWHRLDDVREEKQSESFPPRAG